MSNITKNEKYHKTCLTEGWGLHKNGDFIAKKNSNITSFGKRYNKCNFVVMSQYSKSVRTCASLPKLNITQ